MDTLTFDYSTYDGGYDININGGGGTELPSGGQPGPLTIGTTDATEFNLISGGSINIGDASSPDEIHLLGSISFQYDNISLGIEPFNLTASHYFVEITNSATTTVNVPLASTSLGRSYIISRGDGYVGTLTIQTSGSDTLDGSVPSFNLIAPNQKITIISNGISDWLLI